MRLKQPGQSMNVDGTKQHPGRVSPWPSTTTSSRSFSHKFVGDLGATVAAASVVIGHNLGLYKALAGKPATAEELASRTDTNPRYVAEWLRGQAAGGYVYYDAASDSYSMTRRAGLHADRP